MFVVLGLRAFVTHGCERSSGEEGVVFDELADIADE